MPLSDGQHLKIRQDVLSRMLDSEAVLLDLKSGTYYGLNEVGSEMWELMRAGATVAEIRDKILDLFEVDRETVERDLEELVKELAERGLIDIDG